MLQMADRALSWVDENPTAGPETSRHAIFLGEIAASAGYASLVSLVSAAAFVACSVSHGIALQILTAIALGLAVHLALIMSMVMTRVYQLIAGRLTRARTLGTVRQLPQRTAK
jgi:predicted phage tail protein